MLLLVSAGRFNPRRRPQPAREEMPLRPLLEVLTFWMLLVLGGLFVTMDAMQLYAAVALGVHARHA